MSGPFCHLCESGVDPEIVLVYSDDQALADHIEMEHHLVVLRPGDTKLTAVERFLKQNPGVLDCPACGLARTPWTTLRAGPT